MSALPIDTRGLPPLEALAHVARKRGRRLARRLSWEIDEACAHPMGAARRHRLIAAAARGLMVAAVAGGLVALTVALARRRPD